MLAELEQALHTRVQTLLGATVKTVDALPGRWDIEALRSLIPRCPAVFTLWTGGSQLNTSGPSPETEWILYLVTNHQQGQAARRVGDVRAIGAWTLVERLYTGFHGWFSGVGGSVEVLKVDNLWTPEIEEQGVALYALTLKIPITLDPLEIEDVFSSLNVSYDIAPSDERLDAEDLISPEQE